MTPRGDPYLLLTSDEDYGSEDSEEVRKKTKAHNDRAYRRRGRLNTIPATAESVRALPIVPGEFRIHGTWANTRTETIEEAEILIAAAETNADALRYLDFLNTRLQSHDRDRTPGQQSIVTRWGSFIRFNGGRRDQARIDVGLPVPHKKGKRPDPPAPAGTTSDRMVTDEAVDENPAANRSTAEHTAWIASLRPGQRGFAAVPASQWPAGLRQLVGGEATDVPRGIRNVFLEPHDGDCAAASTTRRLGPLRNNKDNASNIRRQEFLRVWWGVFGTPGLFVRLANELNLAVGDRTLEHFPYDTRNVDALTVVRWALDHGIGPTSTIVTHLEEYAPLTLARQANLASFPQRTVDAWVEEFSTLLRTASHTLRYPPMVTDGSVITTSSELQLLARVPTTAPQTVAPAAPPIITLPATAASASSSTPGPGISSADTGTAASELPTTAVGETVIEPDVEMKDDAAPPGDAQL